MKNGQIKLFETILNEVTLKQFGLAIAAALYNDIATAQKTIESNGDKVSPNNNGTFSMRDLQRYANINIPKMINSFEYDGLYDNDHDGDPNHLQTNQATVTKAYLKFAKTHPESYLGKLYSSNQQTVERMLPYIIDRYFLSADTYKDLRYKRQIN